MQAGPGGALVERRTSRPWAVRAVGLLLLLQAAAFVALCVFLLWPHSWDTVIMTPQQIDAIVISIILIPTAFLATLAAIGFLFLVRAGWLLAMAVQGGALLGCLMLYYDTRHPAIYPVMVVCILLAFYLNSADVRVAFHGGTVGHGQ